jgi:guanine deaminase
MMKNKEEFMHEAIRLASEGMNRGDGGPFGAVIVKDNNIIGRGWNCVTSLNDPTAHAEIMAIRNACTSIGSFQLDNCEIYTSCEPCPMCLGAIYWARPSAIYYACNHDDAADAGFDDSFIYKEFMLHAEERKIPSTSLLRLEALKIFKNWIGKQDKIDY